MDVCLVSGCVVVRTSSYWALVPLGPAPDTQRSQAPKHEWSAPGSDVRLLITKLYQRKRGGGGGGSGGDGGGGSEGSFALPVSRWRY